MIGLGDRVEAWARRFGVPPPADARPEDGEPAHPREDADETRAEAPERFTRREREPR